MARLVGSVRFWRVIAALALAGMGCTLLQGDAVRRDLVAADVVHARRIEVQDEMGATRVLLEVGEHGEPKVVVSGDRGKEAAVLTQGELVFLNERGVVTARLSNGKLELCEGGPEGSRSFVIEAQGSATSLSISAGKDPAKTAALSVKADADGGIVLEIGGGPERGRIEMVVAKDEEPRISLFGKDGALLWSAPPPG